MKKIKQPDFISLKGIWHLMYHHKGYTELMSDKMRKEFNRRKNSPKKDHISFEELFKKIDAIAKKKK